ncbi:MAG: glycosyltransferase family 2 protein [Bdellovibrionales bacterium]|nr:glycosyltransferase family 2 protein [Bdellovibrionales bacterium]
MLKTSVIIPTLQRGRSLERCLRSLVLLATAAENFELIVVDNAPGGDAETAHVVQTIAQQHPTHQIRYISEPALGIHNARHTGARVAKGTWLAYADDDTTFCPEWLNAYLHMIGSNPRVVAGGGPIRPIWDDPAPKWLLDYIGSSRNFGILSLLDLELASQVGPDALFYGANMFVRRDALFRVGGFNPEAFGERWVGDGESGLLNKLRAENSPVAYVHDAIVYHHIPRGRMNLSYFRKRMRNQGACDMFTRYHPNLAPRRALVLSALQIAHRRIGDILRLPVSLLRHDRISIDSQLRAVQAISQAHYCLRLAVSSELRCLVQRERWLD